MKKDEHTQSGAAELRRRAEEKLKAVEDAASAVIKDPDVVRLIHELQVYQIELELQNEELMQARNDAVVLRETYADLYDFAPVGYFTLNRRGDIVRANLTGSNLLRQERSRLVHSRFALFISSDLRPAFSAFLESVFESQAKQACEVALEIEQSAPVHVRIDAVPKDSEECGIAVVDITDRKRAEENERELEAHKLAFYQKTILAATNGKLEVVEPEEIRALHGELVRTWRFSTPDEYFLALTQSFELAKSLGFVGDKLHRFMSCAGEMLGNAQKHAGGGEASFLRTDNHILFVVSDTGPGIASINLPDIAFVCGYSTTGTAGLGYKFIIRSADKTYLATGPGGTTVAVEMALHETPPTLERGLSKQLASWSD